MNSKSPYKPQSLPPASLDWEQLVTRIGMANSAIARYDGILQSMVNPTVLLSPLTSQEAVLSSRIEGTQTTLKQILEYDAAPSKEAQQKGDLREVVNYRTAMQQAVTWIPKTGLDLKLICHIHRVLLAGVRGQHSSPGTIRNAQNWIGRPETPIEQAIYIPPTPEDLALSLPNLENFMTTTYRDVVVQTALIHAQFELLHPFGDGNGRVGRILIPLMFYEKGLMATPTFYISEYFEAHQSSYYDRLAGISAKNDWQGWVAFFLQAVEEQAALSVRRATAILELYNRMKDEINKLTRSQYTLQTLDALFDHPILTTPDFINRTGIPRRTAFRILDDLQSAKILVLHEEGAGRRPAKLAFARLVKITEQKTFE
jgi:Fic family protein